eukprot:CAMPEP_0204363954 /NCGR_PEP_ID=MMETSP0469-20131031/40756_1 /ASSEMBLY_ACC=CAM_ASM_000384 /TAXON_ID=2969 /ORGANISM="Oxyrrhis marina" /LENGTH=90 /DNA_ID=CAMNT_0051352767 /DNA_START=1 /DNA_END=270 /DNA_ORIENTATION=-
MTDGVVDRAVKVVKEGHGAMMQLYRTKMVDPEVPEHLRQLAFSAEYSNVVNEMLGRCGFMKKCYPRVDESRFFLPKYARKTSGLKKPLFF